MTTFDRYLLRRYLHVFVILFISTFGLYVVIDGFTNVDGFQEGSQSTRETLVRMGSYYSVQSSVFFDLVAAILAVISVMVVFALLLKHGEVHPILAAGIPAWRLLVPCLAGALLVNGAIVANQELVIPRISHRIQAPRHDKEDRGQAVQPINDFETCIWIGGKELFLADRRMDQANFVLPAPGIASDLTTLRAREAVYYPAGPARPAGWLLKGVVPGWDELSLTEAGREVVLPAEDADDLFVASNVTFDQLYNRNQNYRYASTPDLVRRMRNRAISAAAMRGQALTLHLRLVGPLGNLLAVLVAVPVVLRRESRSLIGNMALCTGILCTLYGTSQLFVYLGQANLISLDLAAWASIILAGMLAAWLSGMMQT